MTNAELESKLRSRFLNMQYEINGKDPRIARAMRQVPDFAVIQQEMFVLGGFAAIKILTAIAKAENES